MGFKTDKFFPFNLSIFFAILLLIVQQVISASSTIWLARLIANIQQENMSFFFLWAYLAALFLPYLPGALALVEVARAKVKANVSFVDRFARVYRGRIIEWANASQHTTKSSILTGEAPQTINEYIDYVYYFCSYGFNVTFNLLTLVCFVEPLLLLSYGLGISLAFLVLKFQKKWKKTLALRAQQGRIKWISMLLKAWDNVLLNNSYSYQIWQNKVKKRAQRLVGSNLKLEGFRQKVSMGMALLLFGPSFALICYLASSHSHDLTWLAITIVSLPRLLQVLSFSYDILFVLADFPEQKNRLKTILKLLETTHLFDEDRAKSELERRIQWDKIIMTSSSESFSHPKQLIDALPSSGRITIQGENGSGKTSLLLLLKVLKGESAFYLPAKHGQVFNRTGDKLSTGQRATVALSELLENLNTPIVMLDEWDAHLDKENSDKISILIDKISHRSLVLESRHIRQT